MRFLWRWSKRAVFALLILILLLLSPIAYVETACRGAQQVDPYQPILSDPAWHRAETRTLLTYPEWHIVHAYDDYARVIRDGVPHDFKFIKAAAGFWTSLCPLNERAAQMGGVTGETKMTIYTIGVSFTAEMLAKAAYEETIGRLALLVSGGARAELDDLSATQASDYAIFLQQTPWYEWDFEKDALELKAVEAGGFRNTERRLALGLEYSGKAAYAKAIAKAVEGVGQDALRIRSVVSRVSAERLSNVEGVTIISEVPEGIIIETQRYRAFTRILEQLADADADLLEIGGNNDILFTATSASPTVPGALFSFQRQGYADYRHLVLVPVTDLLSRLRALDGMTLEHVHDY